MKIISQRHEQAEWGYNGCRFRVPKGNLGSHSSESVARNLPLPCRSLPMSRVKLCLIGAMTLLILLCGVNAMAATVEVGRLY